jgi:tetratricopeptide (TPR) repeat protein
MRRLVAAAALGLCTGVAMAAVDLDALWTYADPAASEARLRAALASAAGDDALVLRTQIARTYSLRKRFADAHAELDAIAPQVAAAGDEAKVHALLERGRTLRSAGDTLAARPLFVRAVELAEGAGLERLAADAMHMVALAEPGIDEQVAWHRRTIDYARAARDPKARGWEAPALNNLGVTLREAGRLDEALAVFRDAEQAYASRQPEGEAVLVARWQIANVLRLQGRLDDALAMQLALEAAFAARGTPDPYVFDELALLYGAKGDAARAAAYRERQSAAQR